MMFLLVLSIVLGALGQLFLKIASDGARDHTPLLNFYTALAMSYHLWLGFISYGLSFLIWMRVLAEYDLSYARPMMGLGYIVTVLLAMFFLGEKVTLLRWIGIVLTTAGIIVLNLSRNG